MAESRDVARRAAAAVNITYDGLPAIFTIEVIWLLIVLELLLICNFYNFLLVLLL